MSTSTATAASWEMKVGGGNGGEYEYVLCPAGNYPGIIVGMFDIGYQTYVAKDGTTKEQRRLILAYELARKRPDGKPFILVDRFTWSMNEKANFYKLVTNVTGARFKDGDAFNPLGLLGVPVMINVTNSPSGDKTYHNVGSVSQFPEGFPVPTPGMTPISWSVHSGEPFPAVAEALPFVYGESIKALAEGSAEWKARKGNGVAAGADAEDPIPF